MITIKNKFSPSVNIIRDNNINFNYINTANNSLIFKQILNGFNTGAKRSFSIVGAYGSGKSSFLWAVEKTLTQTKNLFQELENELENIPKFDCLSIVGSYTSLIGEISDKLDIKGEPNTKEIFKKLDILYQAKASINEGLVIFIDEFGKFLEYAAKNVPDKELYFIQQLAEYANNPSKNIIFLITLHQGFDAYSLDLTKVQRQEWDKVRGRLKELAFNEPVEQLLLLAAKRINAKPNIDNCFKALFSAIAEANAFPLRDYFSIEVAAQLYPFDILSAATLTLALQKYGQNERSLFSFIDGDEYLSLSNIDTASSFFNLASVYDYLSYNYYYFLNSKQNPDAAQWAGIKNALERIESINSFTLASLEIAKKIIKTIGLLNIFSAKSLKLNPVFLSSYAQYSLDISATDFSFVLKELEQTQKVIIYRKYAHKYVLTEGTDLDIQQALLAAEADIEPIVNVADKIQSSFSFNYLLAKENYFKFGTPRFFSFILSDSPIHDKPIGEIDGYINLIFSKDLSKSQIEKISKLEKQAILYGLVTNTESIKKNLLDILVIKKVIELNQNDKVAVRELNSMLTHQEKNLNDNILNTIYSTDSNVLWFFGGKSIVFKNQSQFNRYLSNICDEVYHLTPKVVFEMINKTKLSSAMLTARKKLLEALTTKYNEVDLGFEKAKFPPEKSIYQVLLKTTGIHKTGASNTFLLTAPTDNTILPIWSYCEAFLKKSQSNPRYISELVQELLSPPIKLKEGFLSFWLPIFLFVKRDEFALFENGMYVPELSKDILELIAVRPENYQVKAFNVNGINLDLFNSYRELLEQNKEISFSNKKFIDTIRPFLKFYRDLPIYAKNTQRLSQEAIALRQAIAEAKDPEKSFFEDFPTALGYTVNKLQSDKSSLVSYAKTLEATIKELRTAFDNLISRFELYLLERLGFDLLDFNNYKAKIQARFENIKPHLLLAHQKPFFQRINSALDNRQAWLLSIAQACLGKDIESITDAEEPKLFDRLLSLIHELDHLTELSAKNINEDDEVFYQVNISSIATNGFNSSTDSVRLSKKNEPKINSIALKIKKLLSDNHELNIAVLTHLLEEEIRHGEKN